MERQIKRRKPEFRFHHETECGMKWMNRMLQKRNDLVFNEIEALIGQNQMRFHKFEKKKKKFNTILNSEAIMAEKL